MIANIAGNRWLAIGTAIGISSAVLIGYCIYFDAKRRSDPDYKKKVYVRRQREREEEEKRLYGQFDDSGSSSSTSSTSSSTASFGSDSSSGSDASVATAVAPTLSQLSTPAALQRYFLAEIQEGEELVMEGHVEEGVTHMANAIHICIEPRSLLEMLGNILSPEIFHKLIIKLQQMGSERHFSQHGITIKEDTDGDVGIN